MFNAGSSETFSISTETLNGSSTITPWEFFADHKLNNGSTPDCSTNSVKGWICGDTGKPTLSPYSVANGTTAEFIITGTYSGTTPVSTLDLMASGCLVAGTCDLDGGSNNNNKWAVSTGMGTGTTNVPEPGTSTLLMGGFLGLALLGRKALLA